MNSRNGTAGSDRRVGGRYRLDELIGRGGAGAVWRAHDERLDRAVAVKEILWPVDPREFGPERALREARAAARLRDPGVVQVYDMLTANDRAYLVMELVDAPSLQRLVERDGPLPPPRAAALGARILATLSAAHAARIVHRDVKPSNVLVDGDVPRLTDFGIARLADDPALTATGTVMGTPSFIAPEQARGEPAGPAADLYGLGATLYFAVEGVAPFSEETSLQTAMAVVSSPHRPLQRGGELTELIEALLQKDPEARPEREEVQRRLEEVASSAPTPESVPTVPLAHGQDPGEPSTKLLTSASELTAAGSTEEAPAAEPAPRRGGGRRMMAVIGGLLAVVVLAMIGLALLDGASDPGPDGLPAETLPPEADPPAGETPEAETTPRGDAPPASPDAPPAGEPAPAQPETPSSPQESEPAPGDEDPGASPTPGDPSTDPPVDPPTDSPVDPPTDPPPDPPTDPPPDPPGDGDEPPPG